MGGDELETVLIAGDDDAVPAGCLAAAADGADENQAVTDIEKYLSNN